eukprot:8558656-Pyramimonas_sp.AAC.1
MHYLDVSLAKLSSYNLTAEQLEYLPISVRRLTTIFGMHIIKKICHISSFVGRWLYVRTIFDDSTDENSQWGLGWIRYHHGLRWPRARALARSTWINALLVYVTPMGY